ncbi:MAG: hypothetical protein IIA48_06515 [Bacteroidetes bacterium]|nr:hypothetical protein [Bacteroidota bacterium]
MEGWIKLHRQILENEFWFSERFTKAQAWVDLLLLASHKERTLFIKGVEINLQPGQLCHSQVSLAYRWKWNRKTVKKFLNILKKREMLYTKETNITTIITIKTWVLYQGGGQQNGQRTDSETDTNKNGKNVKKELIIEIAKSLIKTIDKESSFYSITNKYLKLLGQDKFLKILSDSNIKGNSFDNENRLAAYLEACKNSNGYNNKMKLEFNPIGAEDD